MSHLHWRPSPGEDNQKLMYPAYERFAKAGVKNVCILAATGQSRSPNGTTRGRISGVTDLAEIPARYGVTNVYPDLGQLFAFSTVVAHDLPRLCWARSSAASRSGRSKVCAASKSRRICRSSTGSNRLAQPMDPTVRRTLLESWLTAGLCLTVSTDCLSPKIASVGRLQVFPRLDSLGTVSTQALNSIANYTYA